MQIWDTGGQEKFRSITTTYYRHASAVVLCFDLSRRETFDSLGRWIEDVRCYAGSNASIVLVGTKSDLAGQASDCRMSGHTADYVPQSSRPLMRTYTVVFADFCSDLSGSPLHTVINTGAPYNG